jgi:hypothetical protein
MDKRVSAGDIAFLVVTTLALALFWRFFSPPIGLVLWSAAAGAVLPVVYRILRTRLPRSLLSLPFVLVLLFVMSLLRDHTGSAFDSALFLGAFASAFASGLCVVEFLLRSFFPLKSYEKQT